MPKLILLLILLMTLIATPLAAQTPPAPDDEFSRWQFPDPFWNGFRVEDMSLNGGYNPGTASFTVSFWFSSEDIYPRQAVIGKGNLLRGYSGFEAAVFNSTVLFSVVGATNVQTASASIPLPITDEWLLFVGVIDREAQQLRVSINGQTSGATFTGSLANVGAIVNSAPVLLGQNFDAGAPYMGYANDFRIYKRALDEQEDDALYAETMPALAIAAAAPTETLVFAQRTGGINCFRIPAIVSLPSGKLVAFAEARINTCGDTGNVDVVMKRSSDHGLTWGALKVVAANGTGVAGNPSVVVDTTLGLPDGRIVLLYNTNLGTITQSDILNGTSVRETWRTTSDDGGENWSAAENITLQIHKPKEITFNPAYNFNDFDWRWYAVEPGSCIQQQRGVYAGQLVCEANHSNNVKDRIAHAIFSSDHGVTWRLGSDIAYDVNEGMPVELSDGNILMAMRANINRGGRFFASTTDGGLGLAWTHPYLDRSLVSSSVQASIERLTFPMDGEPSRILFVVPNDPRIRDKLTAFVSYNDGVSWDVSRLIRARSAGYSDLALLCDNSIGLLYERGIDGGIYFFNFSLDWVTRGADSLPLAQCA